MAGYTLVGTCRFSMADTTRPEEPHELPAQRVPVVPTPRSGRPLAFIPTDQIMNRASCESDPERWPSATQKQTCLTYECTGELEDRPVPGVRVDDERRVREVLLKNVGVDGWNEEIVFAIDDQSRLLNGF
jgi:hypothetical protein